MFNKQNLLGAAVALVLSINTGVAAVTAEDAAKLGSTLTPLGAEKAGNAARTIPAWAGGITSAPGSYIKPGQHHPDPFPEDKVLFTITSSNLNQYKANLSPGVIALFNAYPGSFHLPVYPTRRSGSAPQWVYDNTLKNATTAKLVEDGNGFEGAYGGIPFPIPQSGVEALWNHVARYRGQYVVRRSSGVAVQRNGDYALATTQQQALFNFYNPKGSAATLNNTLFDYIALTTSPARLAGGAVLVHETLDQVKEPRQAWIYNSGMRRVRRAPGVAYDMPIAAADGLYTADDTDMFNGAPDRYDWKLVGKKEIYIPYNNYRIGAAGVKYKDLLQVGHVNPDLTRWELHRVWQIEGTLKAGSRHIYSKRVLFLDEDSWQATEVDQYDSRGELWRVSLAYLKNFYELPVTWTAMDVFHDLQSRRYAIQGLDSEEASTVDFTQPIPEEGYFKPASLRRRGTR